MGTYRRSRRTRTRGCALNAQIIQFAPYLARKQEQEVERLLARPISRSPLVDCGDSRAWVVALVEWSEP